MDTPLRRRCRAVARPRPAPLLVAAIPLFLLFIFAIQLTAQEERRQIPVERLRELSRIVRQAGIGLTAEPASVVLGDEVRFTARLPDQVAEELGERATFEFHFGDGEVLRRREPTAVHAYDQEGQFRAFVRLQVETERGTAEGGSSDPILVTVRPRPQERPPPRAQVSLWAEPREVRVGQPVSFGAELEPPIDGRITYQFVFGDGALRPWSPQPEAVHVYERPGEFSAFVAAELNDDPLARSGGVRVVVIAEYALTLQASDYAPAAGQPVRFTGRLVPSTDGARFQFEFGDGRRSNWLAEPVLEYAYERPGPYDVELRAVVRGREVESSRLTLRVQRAELRELPLLTLVARPPEARPGDVVRFEALGLPPDARVEYRFHFGDGEETGWWSEPTTEHRYADRGSYDAYVEARRADGALGQSDAILVSIVPAPALGPPWWWPEILILVGVLVAVGGAHAVKSWRKRPKPPKPLTSGARLVLQAHPDDGTQELDRGREGLLRAELRLHPVFDPGRQSLESDGPLIKREWTL